MKGGVCWCSSGMLQPQDAVWGIAAPALLAGALLCTVGHSRFPSIPGTLPCSCRNMRYLQHPCSPLLFTWGSLALQFVVLLVHLGEHPMARRSACLQGLQSYWRCSAGLVYQLILSHKLPF